MSSPRILILADINSPHTQKWVNGLAKDQFEIGIFSLNHSESNIYKENRQVRLFNQGHFHNGKLRSKAFYLLVLPKLIYTILKFKPDIIHAHYASSYGLLGAFSFFKPLFVSVWGSDVMDFPKKNILFRVILKFVFARANKIFVTSSVLKNEVSLYTGKSCHIIPFGVNLNEFYRSQARHQKYFTFGCIKHLEKIYNIDKVILAFNLLVKKYPKSPLRLLIVGRGTEKLALERLIQFYGLQDQVNMTGEVPHSLVPYYLNNLDVLVNVSETESFGVSVAEALACEIPVIVSNIDGFRDIVPDENFGLITKSTDVNDILTCMEKYYLDSDLRHSNARAGHASVVEKFNWKENLLQMESIYYEFLSAAK